MKFLVLLLAFFLNGCDQLLRGQEQPVLPRADGNYFTACGGAVETWSTCNLKAQRTCSSGYSVIKKDENGSGTVRELTFKCNK